MNRSFLIGITLSIIALVVVLNINTKTVPEPVAKIIIPNNIDYYLKNTRQKSYKSDGTVDFTLNSDLLEHYKREDKSTLIKPDVVVRRTNTWKISAQQGDFFHPKEIITFHQNVLMDKQSINDPFQVQSDALLFNIQQDLVISESDVKVSAKSWFIKAQHMTLNMNSEIHQFTHVTARYRHDKNT